MLSKLLEEGVDPLPNLVVATAFIVDAMAVLQMLTIFSELANMIVDTRVAPGNASVIDFLETSIR